MMRGSVAQVLEEINSPAWQGHTAKNGDNDKTRQASSKNQTMARELTEPGMFRLLRYCLMMPLPNRLSSHFGRG